MQVLKQTNSLTNANKQSNIQINNKQTDWQGINGLFNLLHSEHHHSFRASVCIYSNVLYYVIFEPT